MTEGKRVRRRKKGEKRALSSSLALQSFSRKASQIRENLRENCQKRFKLTEINFYTPAKEFNSFCLRLRKGKNEKSILQCQAKKTERQKSGVKKRRRRGEG